MSTQKTRPSRSPVRPSRPRQDLVDMVIQDIPIALKKAMIKEANRRESNLTNVAVGCLAARFHVKFYPSDRGYSTVPGDSVHMSFAMPRRLRHKISMEAARRDITKRDVVIETLNGCFAK